MFLNLNALILTEPVTAVVQQSEYEFTIKSGDSFYDLVLKSSGIKAIDLFRFLTSPDTIRFNVGIHRDFEGLAKHFESHYRTETFRSSSSVRLRETTSLYKIELARSQKKLHPLGDSWSVLQFVGTFYPDAITRHIGLKEIEHDTRFILKELSEIFELKVYNEPGVINLPDQRVMWMNPHITPAESHILEPNFNKTRLHFEFYGSATLAPYFNLHNEFFPEETL